MSDSSGSLPPLNFFQAWLDNPVILKELKGRMRGRQGFLALTVHLLLLSFLVLSVYLVFWVENSSAAAPGYLQTVGKSLFGVVVLTEFAVIGFVAPALTSGAIASERERRTFDLLRVSLLSPRELILGKLGAAVAYVFLLMFAALPAQSFAFFLGGVGAAELVISTLMLAVTAVFYCALGLFFSSVSRRVFTSTALTYAFHVFSFLAFFFFLLVFGFIFLPTYSNSAPSLLQDVYAAMVWLFFSLNPFFAAVASEVMLMEEQALFFTTSGFSGAISIPLPAPWLVYVLFYVIASALLVELGVYFVSRPDS